MGEIRNGWVPSRADARRTRDTRAKGASRDAPVTVILPADMVAWEPEVRLEAPARSRASTSAHESTWVVKLETCGHSAVRYL